MSKITLKNGAQEVRQLVAITMMSLRKLFDDDPMVAYDLIMLCRNSDYRPFGSAPDKLAALRLASPMGIGMTVHESIRNIVLSAATGEGMDIGIENPIAVERS